MRLRILVFILALVPLGVWGEDLTITTEQQLRDFATAVNNGNSYEGVTVYLANDISLEGGDWTPIGSSGHPFKGHFEGWGHKISGLNINANTSQKGLFGYVLGGSIRDVAVAGSIKGSDNVGGICGILDGGEISSCYCEASVSGTNNVGGICGTSSGIIKDCYMTSTVDGSTNVGGILGEQTNGTVSECYLSGTVSGSGADYHGSIMGKRDAGTCSDCVYSTNSSYHAIGGADNSTDNEDYNIKGAVLTQEATWTSILDDNTWKIVDGQTPKLYSFLKNEPVTFTFEGPGAHWITFVPNGNYTVPADMRAYIAPTSPFTYTDDDEMAVFVGTTCCGTADAIEVDGTVRWFLRFFPELAGGSKKVKLRYYSAAKKTIYTKDITVPEDWVTLTLEF